MAASRLTTVIVAEPVPPVSALSQVIKINTESVGAFAHDLDGGDLTPAIFLVV